jgi:hypothetical protein
LIHLNQGDVGKRNWANVNLWEVVDTIPEYIAVTNGEGLIIYLNAAWYQLIRERAVGSIGFTIGNHFADSFAASFGKRATDAAAMRYGLAAILNGSQESFTMEYPYHRPGEQHWFTTTISSAYISHGTRGAIIHQVDTTKQKNEQAMITRQQTLLKTLSFVAEQFANQTQMQQRVAAVLERLGQALGVSRVTISPSFLTHTMPSTLKQQYSWLDMGFPRAYLDHDSYIEQFPRWQQRLRQGKPVYGDVASFPAEEQPYLQDQRVHSLAIVPIFVCHYLWGVIQCVDYHSSGIWQESDIDALKTVAGLFGGMLERSIAL